MRLPISEQYFDPIANGNRDLVEDCLVNSCNVSEDVLQFATDYYWVENWIEAIIDYYDLQDEFEDYMKSNREGYVLYPEFDEDEDAWND